MRRPTRLLAFALFAAASTLLHGSTASSQAVAASSPAASSTQTAAPPQQVSYVVTVVDTTHHMFHVTASAEGVVNGPVRFAIPAWSPGWYVLTHASSNISHVTATTESGASLAVTHPDDLTWQVAVPPASKRPAGAASPQIHTITLSYDLLARDPDPDALDVHTPDDKSYGFFAPYLDSDNGFVPGPASLVYVDGGKSAPCRVTYKVPAGWNIATGNDPVPNDPDTFTAPDYDTLADQPADLGHFRRQDRTVEGVPISVVIVGADGISATDWTEDTFQIVGAGIRYMGGKAPFPRYIFHCRFPASMDGGGGLEHRNGTVLTLPTQSLRQPDSADMELIAHEFFHAWNVKRLRPVELGPFDYTHPVRTPDLWWLEGVTDYIAPLLDVQAGVVRPNYWLRFMSSTINELQNNSARQFVTLETASLKAWEGKSEGFGGLSYYNKGAVVGLLLDIEMRRRTQNKVGLSNLLKALYDETVTTGHGYPDGEIERLASSLTGSDMKPFFDRALRSTDELPYSDILPAAGLTLIDAAAGPAAAGLHFNPNDAGNTGIRIAQVETGSPAAEAGLLSGDQLTAIDGHPVSDIAAAMTVLSRTTGPAGINVTVRRDSHLHIFTVNERLRATEHDYRLLPVPNPSPEQAAILAAISSGTSAAPSKQP